MNLKLLPKLLRPLSKSILDLSKRIKLHQNCHIHLVPQESRRTLNPLRGKTEFLSKEKIKVNPNGGKQGGIPEKESPGIFNNQIDPNGRHTELVPRRARGNSNKDTSGSNSDVPAKAKRNPRRESPFEFHAQVRSEQAPKGDKLLSA